MGASQRNPPDPLRSGEIRAQLERILSDFASSGANRRSRLLRYLVEQTLEDRAESLKESIIATEVFDRAPDYDPQIDSVVRVEVGRLRARLAEYYEKAGADASVRIEIPRGAYRPVFVFRETAPEPVAAQPEPGPKRSWIWIAAAAVIAIAAAVLVWRLANGRAADSTSHCRAAFPQFEWRRLR